MILISHRGNIFGKEVDFENSPDFINNALKLNYHVEVDIWYINEKLYLGHDEPQFEIDLDYLNNDKFFVHCKNDLSLELMSKYNLKCDYFWHQNDKYTLTSKKIVWVYPKQKVLKNSIVVLPELSDEQNLSISKGVCSDYIAKYKYLLEEIQ